MATHKHPARKKRLGKAAKHTKWAPFWVVFKKYGRGRRMHPSRITHVKRSWRRTKLKA